MADYRKTLSARPAVTVRLMGGLGNQLFQFATAFSYAERWNAELKLDESWFEGQQRGEHWERHRRTPELGQFQLCHAARAGAPNTNSIGVRFPRLRGLFGNGARAVTQIREPSMRFAPETFQTSPPVRLEGYWQCPGYFEGMRDLLIKGIVPVDAAVSNIAVDQVGRARRPESRLVGVHVRRGDLAIAHEQMKDPSQVGLELLPIEYYRRAMKQFSNNARFLVCSDDIEWCREHLRSERVEFSRCSTALEDFECLRRCDDAIIANSTFSWWSAWLNESPGKRVICPGRWFATSFPLDYSLDELLPTTWERIEW